MDGALLGFRDPTQVSFQVNLMSCYDSKPTLPLRMNACNFNTMLRCRVFFFFSPILNNFLDSSSGVIAGDWQMSLGYF